MQFLTSLFGGSENVFVTALLALGIVIVLIILGVWALKFLSRAGSNVGRTGRRRLTIVDTMAVDPKRRLTIIRRDNVEHLILTGGPQDVVVESGIPVEPIRQVRRTVPTPTPQAKPEPQRSVVVNEEPQLIAEETPAAQRSAMDRLRELSRPRDKRPTGSLRHTGLMRPVSRMEPGIIASIADNSDHLIADSAKEGRVEMLDSRRNGDGQAKGGDGKKGAQR
jgi:flagellar biogenesis protein FliO